MNRRLFLRSLGIVAGVIAIPEPVRKYFFAPAGGWRRRSVSLIGFRIDGEPPITLDYPSDAFEQFRDELVRRANATRFGLNRPSTVIVSARDLPTFQTMLGPMETWS